MNEHPGESTSPDDEARRPAQRRASALTEVVTYLRTRRSILYSVIFVLFILLSALFYFAQSSAVAPFIYTLF